MVEWQASAETTVEGNGAELIPPGAPATFKSPLWGNLGPKALTERKSLGGNRSSCTVVRGWEWMQRSATTHFTSLG